MAQIPLSFLFFLILGLFDFVGANTPTSPIEPAATIVSDVTAAGARLFDFETVQLTEDVLNRVASDPRTSHIAPLLKFDDDSSQNARPVKRQAPGASCKTFPGDANWPTDATWTIFNDLLDGALIRSVPIAAPCYDSEWGPKDVAKCNDVVSRFGTPPLQYVNSHC